MQLPVIGFKQKKPLNISIPDTLINQPVKFRFIGHVVRGLQANRRQASAHTKTRGEVRGGGRKPWRQKGTGRARQGSIRSPQWKGGGIVFGPRSNRNHSTILSRPALQNAKRLLIIDRIKHQAITVVESIPESNQKTKVTVDWLNKLKIPEGNLLIIVEKYSPNLLISARNIPGVDVITANESNAYDIISHSHIIIEQAALTRLLPNTSTKSEPQANQSSQQTKEKSHPSVEGK